MKKNDLVLIYGEEIESNIEKLLNYIKLELLIKNKNASIVLKPNLVLPQNPIFGATTHNEIVIKIIEYLKNREFHNIKIVESSWIGASTKQSFKENGYYEISKKYDVKLVDVKDDRYYKIYENGINVEISKEIMDCDFLINLPVLKGHCQTRITCALKNMKGCISDKSKRDFHNLGLMKPIATLNKVKTADLVIVDSINGDLDFEEGGNPVKTDRIIAALDSVLCDSYAASLLGYEIEEIPYIKIAEELNVGKSNIADANIINLNSPKLGKKDFKPTREVEVLSKYINQKNACSACYGNLIHALKRLSQTNELNRIGKICIGQGYKNIKEDNMMGVGSCTKNFTKSLKGCPPTASEIIKFLKK